MLHFSIELDNGQVVKVIVYGYLFRVVRLTFWYLHIDVRQYHVL